MKVAGVCLCVATLVLSACGPAVQPPKTVAEVPTVAPLTGEQIKAMAGHKWHYVSIDNPGLTADSSMNADGSLETDWSLSGHIGHYSATWRIDGNALCLTGKEDGKTHCSTFRASGNSFTEYNADGSPHGTDTPIL